MRLLNTTGLKKGKKMSKGMLIFAFIFHSVCIVLLIGLGIYNWGWLSLLNVLFIILNIGFMVNNYRNYRRLKNQYKNKS